MKKKKKFCLTQISEKLGLSLCNLDIRIPGEENRIKVRIY